MSYYTIWMGDLPPDCRREHVIKFFEGYGTLGGIRLMNNFGEFHNSIKRKLSKIFFYNEMHVQVLLISNTSEMQKML